MTQTAFETCTSIRVRYSETDAMGVVHHSRYIPWFELGRVEYMDAIGTPYAALEASGVVLAVTQVNVSYRRAAKFDDRLQVRTRLTLLRSRLLRFDYRVENETGVTLIAAFTEHIPLSGWRAVALPEHVRAMLGSRVAPMFD